MFYDFLMLAPVGHPANDRARRAPQRREAPHQAPRQRISTTNPRNPLPAPATPTRGRVTPTRRRKPANPKPPQPLPAGAGPAIAERHNRAHERQRTERADADQHNPVKVYSVLVAGRLDGDRRCRFCLA